jgi:opacity protein-like surface antigen
MLAPRALISVFAGLAIAALPMSAQELSGNGFLFGAPTGNIALRVGYTAPNAGSDIFSFVTSDLTLRRKDFGSFAYGFDFAFRVTPRVDVVLTTDMGGMDKKSEFREWQDNSGHPIEQVTSFGHAAIMLSGKYYLRPYGRTLSRLAWIPARFAPWVSAGVGLTHYSFKQDGDFIDFKANNHVFHDTFESSDWGKSGQISGGVDWNLNHRFALTTQARYFFGKGDLGIDFSGFAPIDLSGPGISTGLVIRF